MPQTRYDKLIINGRFLTAPQTGVQRVACELVSALSARAAEFTEFLPHGISVAVPKNIGSTADPQIADLSLRANSFLKGHLWEQCELPIRSSFSRERSLILNLCNLSPILSKSSIVMIHDAQTFSSPASYSKGFGSAYRTILPIIGRRSLRVLTVSEHSASEIVSYGIARRENIDVIYNGVDHVLRPKPDEAILQKLELEGLTYVLALSSEHIHKNIKVLLKAFSDPSMSQIKLVLFGGKDVRQTLLSGVPIPPNIIWAGRVSDEELIALSKHALCFAMPSTTEGFGLPPLEAMLLGCPAVVSFGGALPEVCGDSALYAAADDPRQWIDALLSLKANISLYSKFSSAGKLRASKFTWNSSAQRLAGVVRDINSNRRE